MNSLETKFAAEVEKYKELFSPDKDLNHWMSLKTGDLVTVMIGAQTTVQLSLLGLSNHTQEQVIHAARQYELAQLVLNARIPVE